MTRTAVLALSAAAGALALTASTAGVAAAAPAASTPVIVDHGDIKNLHVVLDVDGSIAVRFSECGTCGYHWGFIHKPSKTVVQKTSRTNGPHTAPGVVGGSGTHTYVFTGLKDGVTTAKLGYFPPGAHTAPARVVTIKLKVKN
jgi:predicted secreted protein